MSMLKLLRNIHVLCVGVALLSLSAQVQGYSHRRRNFTAMQYTYQERRDAVIEGWTVQECPSFSEEYLTRHADARFRSLSPYGLFLDRDTKRFPRTIIHHPCLCKFCFNIATMKLDPNLFSHNITTDIKVQYMNGTVKSYPVTTGCTCVIPRDFEAERMEKTD